MFKHKLNRTEWNSLTPEQQLQHRELAKTVKQKLKDLDGKHWLSLSKEDQEFLKLHGHELRLARKEYRLKREEAQHQRLVEQSKNKLKSLNTMVTSANKLFCMDLEFHENSKVVTEVGVTLYYPQTKKLEVFHFVVQEYYNRRNGRCVPDHKDDFLWGNSQLLRMKEVEQAVLHLVSDADYLVGHAFENDKKFLAQSGYFKDTKVLDTQVFSRYYFKERQRMSLERVANGLGMRTSCLHNAGNDAFYTMKSLVEMSA